MPSIQPTTTDTRRGKRKERAVSGESGTSLEGAVRAPARGGGFPAAESPVAARGTARRTIDRIRMVVSREDFELVDRLAPLRAAARAVDPHAQRVWGQRLTLDTPRTTQKPPQSFDGVSSVKR